MSHGAPRKAQGLTEYVIIVVLIGIAILLGVRLFAKAEKAKYFEAAGEVRAAE